MLFKSLLYNRECACRGVLLRLVEHKGREVYYPNRVFCYMPLRNHLEIDLNPPGFDNLCSQWKNSTNSEAIYRDVFDGKIWGDFQHYEGKPFLGEPFTYGLMLNIDWFQPCKHVKYSVGAFI